MDRHEYRATWYKEGEPPSRWAYTVRPDIWPPGFIVDTIPVAPLGHDVPLDLYNDHRVWVEIADPRAKGVP